MRAIAFGTVYFEDVEEFGSAETAGEIASKGKSNDKSEIRGFFASLRMTRFIDYVGL